MGLESGVVYIDDLVATNPVGATDNIDEGDDHIRNIKAAVQGSFPSLGNAAVTKTAAEVNNLLDKTGDTMSGNLKITNSGSPLVETWGTVASSVGIRIISVSGGDARLDVLDNAGAFAATVGSFTSAGAASFNQNVTCSISAPTATGHLTRKDYVDAIVWDTPNIATGAITNAKIGNDAVTADKIAADAVTFASEMTDVTINYDFTFADTATQTVTAGMYNYGKDMATSGTMDGTLKLQVQIDSAWSDIFSVTVTNGAATIPPGQITSNGVDVRQTFTYASGAKSSITLRMTKIYT